MHWAPFIVTSAPQSAAHGKVWKCSWKFFLSCNIQQGRCEANDVLLPHTVDKINSPAPQWVTLL